MRRAIDRFVIRIINPLDDVRLLAHSGIWKNRVRSSQIFQVSLKRTDVDGWTMRNIFRNAERIGDFLDGIKPGKLPNAHTHGVARVNETVGARQGAPISPIGVSRRPTPRALYFTGMNRTLADRRAR